VARKSQEQFNQNQARHSHGAAPIKATPRTNPASGPNRIFPGGGLVELGFLAGTWMARFIRCFQRFQVQSPAPHNWWPASELPGAARFGDVADMGRLDAGELPGLAKELAAAVGESAGPDWKTRTV